MSARDVILDLVKKHKPKNYVEVGCWEGVLLDRVKELVPDIWGVDPHKLEYNEFGEYSCRMGAQSEISQNDLDKIAQKLTERFGDRYIRATSSEAVNNFKDDSLDFVFIDAIHDEAHVKEDIKLWLPKVKVGGIIAGDDFKPKRFTGLCSGVMQSLVEFNIIGVVWYKIKQ